MGYQNTSLFDSRRAYWRRVFRWDGHDEERTETAAEWIEGSMNDISALGQVSSAVLSCAPVSWRTSLNCSVSLVRTLRFFSSSSRPARCCIAFASALALWLSSCFYHLCLELFCSPFLSFGLSRSAGSSKDRLEAFFERCLDGASL